MEIQAIDIVKTYGVAETQVTALNNVNIEIHQGDFVAVLGMSGSGKTTLLHILSGLDKPTSGEVCYDGKNICNYSDNEISILRRRTIGFIFQKFNLLPVLSAEENILMPLLLDKSQPKKEYFDTIINMLGLEKRLQHLPNQLSGGQQQRVAIARALMSNPDVIFADEPTGNLDSNAGAEVINFLTTVNRQLGKTIIMITHDENIANKFQKKYYISNGICTYKGL